eukprot:7119565-Prymnesium_polylepis.1
MSAWASGTTCGRRLRRERLKCAASAAARTASRCTNRSPCCSHPQRCSRPARARRRLARACAHRTPLGSPTGAARCPPHRSDRDLSRRKRSLRKDHPSPASIVQCS